MNDKELNVTDREFNVIRSFVTERTEAELTMFICENYNNWVKEVPEELAKDVIKFHKTYKFWGEFDPENQNIEMIQQRASVLKKKWDLIEELYTSLGDYKSKNILVMILENWLSFYFGRIPKVREHNFRSYFDLDLFQETKEEVFVDLGAWKGDTINDFVYTYGANNFKKIYAYEILGENIEILERKYSIDERVVIRPVGVCEKKGTMFLSNNGTSDAQSLCDNGSIEVETVTLDEDIEEKITFLKMDIEGTEKSAILGAKRHIMEDCPKLAISIYHSNDDLVDIFDLVRKIQPNYKFYLRYYGQPYFPTDYILMGVPM